jgi:hypothetical protein
LIFTEPYPLKAAEVTKCSPPTAFEKRNLVKRHTSTVRPKATFGHGRKLLIDLELSNTLSRAGPDFQEPMLR